jgi:hypothetical protein
VASSLISVMTSRDYDYIHFNDLIIIVSIG